MFESKSSEKLFKSANADHITAQQNSHDKHVLRQLEKSEKFQQKVQSRIVEKSWNEIRFYRKAKFLYILSYIGLMLGAIMLVAPIVLFIIWKTGPTYSKRDFINASIIYQHKPYTLLYIATAILTTHIIALGACFYYGYF